MTRSARILPVARDLTAAEAARVAVFEAAPYPHEVIVAAEWAALDEVASVRQHRMDADCWCNPTAHRNGAYNHNDPT